MKSCLFCRSTRIFNIHSDYGNNNHTAKDDMLEFFGDQIIPKLRSDDGICNMCMNIMDNVAKLKRRWLSLILYRSCEDVKPINFGEKWKYFASLRIEDDNDCQIENTSPSLLQLVSYEPYDCQKEEKIAEIERQRSLTVQSVAARSEVDEEIQTAFKTKRFVEKTQRSVSSRRRRRGHHWTRKKKSKYNEFEIDKRPYSSKSKRTISALTTSSINSYYSSYEFEYEYPTPIEQSSPANFYGCQTQPRTPAHESFEEVAQYFSECSEPNCDFLSDDIDLMTEHKKKKHLHMALYYCSTCKKDYTSNEDLQIHLRSHTETYTCEICLKEFTFDTDFMEHWKMHLANSVGCKHCGKRFKKKAGLKRHEHTVHNSNISDGHYFKKKENSKVENPIFGMNILIQNLPKED